MYQELNITLIKYRVTKNIEIYSNIWILSANVTPTNNIYIHIYHKSFPSNIQGTIGRTPNSVPMVFIVFNLGILGDYK